MQGLYLDLIKQTVTINNNETAYEVGNDSKGIVTFGMGS